MSEGFSARLMECARIREDTNPFETQVHKGSNIYQYHNADDSIVISTSYQGGLQLLHSPNERQKDRLD